MPCVQVVKQSDLLEGQSPGLRMVPAGRKHPGKAGKAPAEEQPGKAYDSDKDERDLSGSEEEAPTGAHCGVPGSLSAVTAPWGPGTVSQAL